MFYCSPVGAYVTRVTVRARPHPVSVWINDLEGTVERKLAEEIEENYCMDVPPPGAVERLMKSDLTEAEAALLRRGYASGDLQDRFDVAIYQWARCDVCARALPDPVQSRRETPLL